MGRNIILLVAMLLIISTSLLPQEIHKRIDLDGRNEVLYRTDNSESNSQSLLLSESIGITTNYDNCANNIYQTSILFDTTPLMTSMIRPFIGHPPTDRVIVLSEKDAYDNFIHNSVFDSPGGWPKMDINKTGENQNLLGILDAQGSRLALRSGSENFIIKPTPGNTSSFIFSHGNIFLGLIKDSPPALFFYKSEDLGESYILFDSLFNYSPSPIFGYPMDFEFFKSPNEQHIVVLGVNMAAGHVYDGVPENQADNIWIIYSDDFGNTWTGKTIAVDGKVNSVLNYHTDNFAPLFENFGQVKGSVTNDGTIHITANGYGVVMDSPTGTNVIASSFPVLYWNSVSENWVSVSDISIDTVQAIIDYYPGSSIGQAYPSISVSEDGQIIYIIWTGPQFAINGELEIADNGTGETYYWRDLYHAFSVDGGNSWTYGGILPGMRHDMSECWGQVSPFFETVNPTLYRAHFKFLEDQTTGCAVFDGVLTDNEVIYGNFDIVVTSVDEFVSVSDFRLDQNYPNPFNPSTVIRYQIPEVGYVSLKVYDLLGREVATLVDEFKPAGNYEVEFDASKLSSGVYFYQLQAGSYMDTKKMLLLK